MGGVTRTTSHILTTNFQCILLHEGLPTYSSCATYRIPLVFELPMRRYLGNGAAFRHFLVSTLAQVLSIWHNNNIITQSEDAFYYALLGRYAP